MVYACSYSYNSNTFMRTNHQQRFEDLKKDEQQLKVIA